MVPVHHIPIFLYLILDDCKVIGSQLGTPDTIHSIKAKYRNRAWQPYFWVFFEVLLLIGFLLAFWWSAPLFLHLPDPSLCRLVVSPSLGAWCLVPWVPGTWLAVPLVA